MRILLASAVVAALPLGAQAALSPEGIWVTAEARRILQAGTTGDPGCTLIVAKERVEESCEATPFLWPSPRFGREGGIIEIRSDGLDANRRLILRPGAPSELEVRIEREGEREFYRLYRLEERHRAALETLVQVRDHLLGEWETEDGVALHFGADGSYRFGGDVGRFRAEGGFLTEAGAWIALFFEPEAGPVRRYLVHGRGQRIGLAEVPRDVDLLLPAPTIEEEAEDEEAEEVVVEGIAIPLPGGAPLTGRILPRDVEEPAVGIWLERPAPPPMEENPEELEEEEGDEETPAIAQPIRPARKCGCGSAEGGALGGILFGVLWLFRRRA